MGCVVYDAVALDLYVKYVYNAKQKGGERDADDPARNDKAA